MADYKAEMNNRVETALCGSCWDAFVDAGIAARAATKESDDKAEAAFATSLGLEEGEGLELEAGDY